jgi:hypothetical protein
LISKDWLRVPWIGMKFELLLSKEQKPKTLSEGGCSRTSGAKRIFLGVKPGEHLKRLGAGERGGVSYLKLGEKELSTRLQQTKF